MDLQTEILTPIDQALAENARLMVTSAEGVADEVWEQLEEGAKAGNYTMEVALDRYRNWHDTMRREGARLVETGIRPIAETNAALAIHGLHESIRAKYLTNERARGIFEHYFPRSQYIDFTTPEQAVQ